MKLLLKTAGASCGLCAALYAMAAGFAFDIGSLMVSCGFFALSVICFGLHELIDD